MTRVIICPICIFNIICVCLFWQGRRIRPLCSSYWWPGIVQVDYPWQGHGIRPMCFFHYKLYCILFFFVVLFVTKAGYLAGTHYFLEGLVFFWYAVPKEGQNFHHMQFLSNTRCYSDILFYWQGLELVRLYCPVKSGYYVGILFWQGRVIHLVCIGKVYCLIDIIRKYCYYSNCFPAIGNLLDS